MPIPPSPPFVSTATQQPRQLQRWLDINPQGGALQRTQTYITLPVFSVAVSWKGYSEIVASFNFEAPNNFSFRSLSDLPISPNYALAVSWYDSEGNSQRYFLWKNVGEVIFFEEILYVSQLIKKNFRFEIWSTNVANCSNITAINFYTSVLGILDYRYGTDSALVNADTEVTNFQNINTIVSFPSEIQAVGRWQPSGMVVGGGNTLNHWSPSIGNKIILPNTAPIACLPAIGLPVTPNAVTIFNAGGGFLSTDLTSLGVPLTCIGLAIRFDEAEAGAVIFNDNAGNSLVYTSASQTLTLYTGVNINVTNVALNTWYTVMFGNGQLGVWDLLTSTRIGFNTGAASTTNATTMTIAACNILDIVVGTGSLGNEFLVNYWSQLYGRAFSLPLTFPTNAVSTTN